MWQRFTARFPDADLSFFKQGSFFGDEQNVLFEDPSGLSTAVFTEVGDLRSSIYFSPGMKKALGLITGFPIELTLNRGTVNRTVPAVPFHQRAHPLGSTLSEQVIFVTPDQSFGIFFRDIFKKTQITHMTGAESREWLSRPDMRYWPQQLNFALWCATEGCGVNPRILFEDDVTDHGLKLSNQVRSFMRFHVYFTMRRILFEMGGIQSINTLPGDPAFNQIDNRYDIPSYKRICAEFGVDPSSDFRFTFGQNHGLGYIFVYYPGPGGGNFAQKRWVYPHYNQLFKDEGGDEEAGTLVKFIRNDQGADKQFEFFVPATSPGLTQAGLARLNQSIESFCYCVLGAQVNTRSSILGSDGSAKETQRAREFLTLVESAIIEPDISKSISRFQNAVGLAKVRLDMAISPGTWLLPSRMVINTQSIVGYNNRLQKATPGMKIGINGDVNRETKGVGVVHNLGESKVKLPHPAVSAPKKQAAPTVKDVGSKLSKTPIKTQASTPHEVSLAVITIATTTLVWWISR